MVGLRNPIAPPLDIRRSSEGRAWADFHLGAAYEVTVEAEGVFILPTGPARR